MTSATSQQQCSFSISKCFDCSIYDHRKTCICDCHKCEFFLKHGNHCGYCIEKGTAIKCQTCMKKFRLNKKTRGILGGYSK